MKLGNTEMSYEAAPPDIPRLFFAGKRLVCPRVMRPLLCTVLRSTSRILGEKKVFKAYM